MLRRCIVALVLSSAALALTGTHSSIRSSSSSTSISFIIGADAQVSASPAVVEPAAVSASPAVSTPKKELPPTPKKEPCLGEQKLCVDITGQTADVPSPDELKAQKKPATLRNKQHHRFCDPLQYEADPVHESQLATFSRFQANAQVCIVMGINLSKNRLDRQATNQQLASDFFSTNLNAASPHNILPHSRIGQGERKEGSSHPVAGTAFQGNSVVFNVKVDEFSELYLDKSFSNSDDSGDDGGLLIGIVDPVQKGPLSGENMEGYENMEIQIEVGGVASPPVPRRGGKNHQLLVPFWTAIVRLENGKVFDIEWDSGCFSCDPDQCVETKYGDFCAEDMVKHNRFCFDDDCNLRIYLAWIGTDADGHYMTSAGMRFSQFTKYSASDAVKNAYASGKGAYNDAKQGVNDAKDEV